MRAENMQQCPCLNRKALNGIKKHTHRSKTHSMHPLFIVIQQSRVTFKLCTIELHNKSCHTKCFLFTPIREKCCTALYQQCNLQPFTDGLSTANQIISIGMANTVHSRILFMVHTLLYFCYISFTNILHDVFSITGVILSLFSASKKTLNVMGKCMTDWELSIQQNKLMSIFCGKYYI